MRGGELGKEKTKEKRKKGEKRKRKGKKGKKEKRKKEKKKKSCCVTMGRSLGSPLRVIDLGCTSMCDIV